jgi:hypothetical protein
MEEDLVAKLKQQDDGGFHGGWWRGKLVGYFPVVAVAVGP